ncbi:hypothetical protein OHV05_00015 [Kitasatospora sp. NBC_00070]|uniref:hypothetical protein n=1 Tax=Kitasatospora sp. NBC_00070 TaxID=2975962 RepID=UPI0032562D21
MSSSRRSSTTKNLSRLLADVRGQRIGHLRIGRHDPGEAGEGGVLFGVGDVVGGDQPTDHRDVQGVGEVGDGFLGGVHAGVEAGDRPQVVGCRVHHSAQLVGDRPPLGTARARVGEDQPDRRGLVVGPVRLVLGEVGTLDLPEDLLLVDVAGGDHRHHERDGDVRLARDPVVLGLDPAGDLVEGRCEAEPAVTDPGALLVGAALLHTGCAGQSGLEE